MRLPGGSLAFVLAALAVCAFAAPALGDSSAISEVRLEGKTASGTATLLAFPNHGEIDLKARGLEPERNPVYLAWLVDADGDARIGGAFPRSRAAGFQGSLIVPGPRKEGIGKLRATRRLVITKVSRQLGLRIADRAKRSNFRDSLEIRGATVMKGRAEPASGFLSGR